MRLTIFVSLLLITIFTKGQTATFLYQYDDLAGKAGTFTLKDEKGNILFTDSKASAGYLGGANNPYLQLAKNIGPIPNGTWEIYAVKDSAKHIMRLRPMDDVMMPKNAAGKYIRDGFLIHGIGDGKTAESTSNGCIVIAPQYRKILYDYFKKAGTIKLKVTNILSGSGGTHG